MRMSTKGRFAVNALIDLALREPAGPVALAAICARQQISLSYLEQLFSRLRQQRPGGEHARPRRRLYAGPQRRRDQRGRHRERGRRTAGRRRPAKTATTAIRATCGSG